MNQREGTVVDVLQEVIIVKLKSPIRDASEVSIEKKLIMKEGSDFSLIKKMDKVMVHFSQDGSINNAKVMVNSVPPNTYNARKNKIIIKPNRDFAANAKNLIAKDTNSPEKILINHSISLPLENKKPNYLLETINCLNLSNENFLILSSTFVSYRRISTGPNNLGLAIFEGMINYCFIYSDLTMIYQMHELLNKYHYLLINSSENTIQLLARIIEIFNIDIKLYLKLEQLFELYNANLTDLVLIFRNCLQILVRIMYFSPKYEEFREFRTQSEVLTRACSLTATPELDHFNFVIDYFNVSLRLINGDYLRVTDTGNIGKYIIHLYQCKSGYYPLYTNFEDQLINSEIPEYQQALRFWKSIKQDTIEPDEKISALLENLEEAKNQKKKAANMLVTFSKLYDPQPNFDNFLLSLEEENRKYAATALEGFYCHNCRNIQESIMLPCQHNFCQQCISLLSKESQVVCSQCQFSYEINPLVYS